VTPMSFEESYKIALEIIRGLSDEKLQELIVDAKLLHGNNKLFYKDAKNLNKFIKEVLKKIIFIQDSNTFDWVLAQVLTEASFRWLKNKQDEQTNK